MKSIKKIANNLIVVLLTIGFALTFMPNISQAAMTVTQPTANQENNSTKKVINPDQGEVYLDHNAYLYDHNGNIQTYIQDGIKRKVLWWKGEEHDYTGKIQFRKIKEA